MNIEDLFEEDIGLVRSWRLGNESLQCINNYAKPGLNTIETGIGYSTIAFAASGSNHNVCFVDEQAKLNVIRYAEQNHIDVSHVSFVPGRSQYTLPGIKAAIDFALIDGDHAFPMPVIDFYYIGMMTKVGGHILVDDMHIKSVYDIYEFAKTSKWWECISVFDDGRSLLLRKMGDFSHDWFGIQDYNSIVPPRINLKATKLL